MYDILADFDFVYCHGILYRLRVLALAFYDGLFICYIFFVVCSFPGIICRFYFLCAFFAHLCANLATYSPACSFFSLSITIRTKTGNIP